jgi:hypothetical protein
MDVVVTAAGVEVIRSDHSPFAIGDILTAIDSQSLVNNSAASSLLAEHLIRTSTSHVVRGLRDGDWFEVRVGTWSPVHDATDESP